MRYVPALADDPRTPRLRANLLELRTRIESARGRGAHGASDVRLLVVTKSQPTSIFRALVAAGVTDVGENRVPAAARRRPQAPAGLTWHGIGHLQRNKARTAVGVFDAFHALDSLRLAERLEALLAGAGRRWPVYLQINAAQDAAKHGFEPEEAPAILAAMTALEHLQVVGFMTMGRVAARDAELRSTFRTLREVRDEAVRCGRGALPPRGLSMGMSNDFEIAVEEGATVVRLGSAVFQDVAESRATAHSADDEHTGPGAHSTGREQT